MAAVLDSVRAFFAHNTFTIDQENPGDVVARENLLDAMTMLFDAAREHDRKDDSGERVVREEVVVDVKWNA